MSPVDVERLPDSALEEARGLCRLVEEGLAWPWQAMAAVGRLLGKKSGGDRVMGLLATFCRLWSMAREGQMRQWALG